MRPVMLYVAASLDGFIARSDGAVDWLDAMAEVPGLAEAYGVFLGGIGDIVMGRATYDQILGFGTWPIRLGRGLRLFGDDGPERRLRRGGPATYGDVVELRYQSVRG